MAKVALKSYFQTYWEVRNPESNMTVNDTSYFLSDAKVFDNSSHDRWKNTFVFLKLNPGNQKRRNYSDEEMAEALENKLKTTSNGQRSMESKVYRSTCKSTLPPIKRHRRNDI